MIPVLGNAQILTQTHNSMNMLCELCNIKIMALNEIECITLIASNFHRRFCVTMTTGKDYNKRITNENTANFVIIVTYRHGLLYG